ncbi:MAG: citrate (pro-3S)-lyase subunit beta [Sphaerochaetaceae bacterium]|jgi:citrate lyase subunit beta/citryl-CoA lyase|nr:citrate (pro-3S)-lyase subunit beta [Sphaerochaetaceae bacterium]
MRLRRTMLFVPGNNPAMIQDAHIYGSDALMFDLEDSVAMSEKDAARMLVYHALKTVPFGNCEVVVRINPLDTPYGKKDIEAMVLGGVQVIRLPKTETAQDILDVECEIEKVERKAGIPVGKTAMMAAIEGALGVVNAYEIARSSRRLIAIALGAEDYCANMKTSRSESGEELFLARAQIVVAARAAGIDAIDTVYSDINNEEQLIKETKLIKQLGFDGKSIINPRQIDPINQIFTPTAKEIEKAMQIVEALEQAQAKGSGIVSLNGKMIDKPVLLRAQRTLDMARASMVLFD